MKSHLQKTINAIQTMNIELLSVLLIQDHYQHMPTDEYIRLFKKAFVYFMNHGEVYLQFKLAECHGSECHPTPQIFEFISSKTNKKLPLAFEVQGGQVTDIYQCYRTCSLANISESEMITDFLSYYLLDTQLADKTWSKQNPYKDWQELQPILEKATLDINRYCETGLWSQNNFYKFLNDHNKIYGFCKFYNLDIDHVEYRRTINIYNTLRHLHHLNALDLYLQQAIHYGKELQNDKDRENWLYDYSHLIIDLPIRFDNEELCLKLNGIDYIKLPIEYFATPWQFISLYKNILHELLPS